MNGDGSDECSADALFPWYPRPQSPVRFPASPALTLFSRPAARTVRANQGEMETFQASSLGNRRETHRREARLCAEHLCDTRLGQ